MARKKPFHTQLAPAVFSDNGVFETKAGDQCQIARVKPVDYESLEPHVLDKYTRKLKEALFLFGPEFTVYQYFEKRNRPVIPLRGEYADPVATKTVSARKAELESRSDHLYTVEIHIAVLLHNSTSKAMLSAVRMGTARQQIEVDRARMVELLRNRFEIFAGRLKSISGLRVEELDAEGTFQFLQGLVNFNQARRGVVRHDPDKELQYQIPNEEGAVRRSHLEIGSSIVRAISVKDTPVSKTRALMFRELTRVDANCRICMEWRQVQKDKAKKQTEDKRDSFDATKISLWKRLITKEDDEQYLHKDEEAEENIRNLGEALKGIARENPFGHFSCTVLLYDESPERVKRASVEVAKTFPAPMIEERSGTLDAFLCTIPGNYSRNRRRLLLPLECYADFSLVWASSTGQMYNPHLKDEALLLLETLDRQLYGFSLHDGSGNVGMYGLGAPGVGKSFLGGAIADNVMKYTDTHVLILDMGHSYRDVTRKHSGSYITLSKNDKHSAAMSPFMAMEPTDENISFLSEFTKILLRGEDNYKLNPLQGDQIHKAVRGLMMQPVERRRLSNLVLQDELAIRLRPWQGRGEYGHFFDNDTDCINLSRFTTVEFQGFEKAVVLVTAILYYITQRFNTIVFNPALADSIKLLLTDEAHFFLLQGDMAEQTLKNFATGRKNRFWNVFLTQSPYDAEAAGIGPKLREVCPTMVFLSNPRLDEARYLAMFPVLGPQGVKIIRELEPRKQMYVVSTEASKILELNVAPEISVYYGRDPERDKVKEAAIAQYGWEKGLAVAAESLR